jgi:hypothetical protein
MNASSRRQLPDARGAFPQGGQTSQTGTHLSDACDGSMIV